MPRTNLLFQLKQVNKTYTTGENPFIALNNVSLDIFSGEFLGITGKSGVGKNTLLNMISGVSQLTSGEVFYFNSSEGNPGQMQRNLWLSG